MLPETLTRLAQVIGVATLIAIPVFAWMERRYRPRWPERPAPAEPAGRGAYRRGLVQVTLPGRAPVAARAAAMLLLVGAGLCFWDAPMLLGWTASIAPGTSPGAERLVLWLTASNLVLFAAAPALAIAARRLLRPDPALRGMALVLGGLAAAGAAAMLAAGTTPLPLPAHRALERPWLTMAVDVLALEACAIAFWIGAAASLRRNPD